MQKMFRLLLPTICALSVVWPAAASAYVGPGAGLGAIGALVGLLGAVVLALIGLVWYPLKRLLRVGKAKRKTKPQA